LGGGCLDGPAISPGRPGPALGNTDLVCRSLDAFLLWTRKGEDHGEDSPVVPEKSEGQVIIWHGRLGMVLRQHGQRLIGSMIVRFDRLIIGAIWAEGFALEMVQPAAAILAITQHGLSLQKRARVGGPCQSRGTAPCFSLSGSPGLQLRELPVQANDLPTDLFQVSEGPFQPAIPALEIGPAFV